MSHNPNHRTVSNEDIVFHTVVQSLSETIRDREAVIAQLRDELARTKDLLRERSTNYGELAKENTVLRNEIESLCRDEKEQREIHQRDLKELYRLQEAIRPLNTENIRLTAQRDQANADYKRLKADNERLKAELANSSQDFGRGDAYWTAIKERDDARRLCCADRAQRSGEYREEVAHSLGWHDLYCDCCGNADDLQAVGDCGGGAIMWCKSCRTKYGKDEQNELNNSETQNRRTRRSDFITEQKSDSDPVTGVQYGDLV